MRKILSFILCSLLSTTLVAQVLPHRDFKLQWNEPTKTYIEVNQYDTTPLWCYTYQGTSVWSSTGWDGYMKWAKSKEDMDLNGGVTVTGQSQNAFFSFTPGTNTFYKSFSKDNPGYVEIYFTLPISNQTATIASGSLVVNSSPGKNSDGKLARTYAIVGDSYGPFTGDFSAWPFVKTNGVGGSYLELQDFATYSNHVKATYHPIADFQSYSNIMATYTNWSITGLVSHATYDPFYVDITNFTNWATTNFQDSTALNDLENRYESTSNLLNVVSNQLNSDINDLEGRYATTSNNVTTLLSDMTAVVNTTAQNTAAIAVNSGLISALRTDYSTTSNLLNVVSNKLRTDFTSADLAVSNALEAKIAADIGTYSNYAETAFMDDFVGTYKVIYSDGSGNKQEVSLGAANTVLASTGPSQAPEWKTFSQVSAISFTNDFIPTQSNSFDIGSAPLPVKAMHFGADGATRGIFYEGVKRIGHTGSELQLKDNSSVEGNLVVDTNLTVGGNAGVGGDLTVTSNTVLSGTVSLGSEVITNWSDIERVWEYPSFTNIIYVAKNGNDANDGRSPEEPKLTITDAINDNYIGLTNWLVIDVGPGSYNEAVLLQNLISLRGDNKATIIEQTSVAPLTIATGNSTNYMTGVTAISRQPNALEDFALRALPSSVVIAENCSFELLDVTTNSNVAVVNCANNCDVTIKNCELKMVDQTVQSGAAYSRRYFRCGDSPTLRLINNTMTGSIKDSNDELTVLNMEEGGSVFIVGNNIDITPNAISASGTKYRFLHGEASAVDSRCVAIGNYCRFNGSGNTSGDAMFLDADDGDWHLAGNFFLAQGTWENAWGIDVAAGATVVGSSVFQGVTNVIAPSSAGKYGIQAPNWKQEWYRYENTGGYFEFSSNAVFSITGTVGTNWTPAVSNSFTLGTDLLPWNGVRVSTNADDGIKFVGSDVSIGVNGGGKLEFRDADSTNSFGEDVHASFYIYTNATHSQTLTGTYSIMTNWTEYTNAYAPATVNVTADPIKGTMIPTEIGWVGIFGDMSYTTDASEDFTEFAVFLDNVEQEHIGITRKTSINDKGACTFSGRLYAWATTNVIDVRIKATDGSAVFTPVKCSFWITDD